MVTTAPTRPTLVPAPAGQPAGAVCASSPGTISGDRGRSASASLWCLSAQRWPGRCSSPRPNG